MQQGSDKYLCFNWMISDCLHILGWKKDGFPDPNTKESLQVLACCEKNSSVSKNCISAAYKDL